MNPQETRAQCLMQIAKKATMVRALHLGDFNVYNRVADCVQTERATWCKHAQQHHAENFFRDQLRGDHTQLLFVAAYMRIHMSRVCV